MSGVLVAAKALSEETLSENRSACLDLMELILGRMNGDIQRLARICGPSLSDKARRLVEERWQRRSKSGGGVPPRPIENASRRSNIPTPKKGSPPEKPQKRASPPKPLGLAPRHLEGSSSTILRDELPALNLRTRGPSPAKDFGSSTNELLTSSSKNFLAGFNASTDSLGFSFSSTMLLDDNSTRGKLSLPSSTLTPQKEETEEASALTAGQSARRESYGAAASLRARLLKIREKSKNPDSSFSALSPGPDSKVLASTTRPSPVTPIATQITASSAIVPIAEPPIAESAGESNAVLIVSDAVLIADANDNGSSTAFETGMKCIEHLLSKPIPLDEADQNMDEAIETMKLFHSAFSKQQTGADLTKLRLSIADNENAADEMIEKFSRYVLMGKCRSLIYESLSLTIFSAYFPQAHSIFFGM